MARLTSAEGEVLLDEFRRYLRDHGQPVTRPRDRVARVVLRSDEHLSVEQIHQQLGAHDLAHEADEVLCVRQDVCALIGSMLTRTFCRRLARRQLGAFLCC